MRLLRRLLGECDILLIVNAGSRLEIFYLLLQRSKLDNLYRHAWTARDALAGIQTQSKLDMHAAKTDRATSALRRIAAYNNRQTNLLLGARKVPLEDFIARLSVQVVRS